jgi:hypothetical protein
MDTTPDSPREPPAAPLGPPGGADDEPEQAREHTAHPPRHEATGAQKPRHDIVVSEDTITIEKLDRDRVKEQSPLLDMVKEEVIRAAVALLLILLFAAVVVGGYLRAKTWADTKELLDVVMPAVTALLGSALGFYFGKKGD